MKQIPLLFQTPMVQAIEQNRKTKTRRTKGLDEINRNPDDWELVQFRVRFIGKELKYEATFNNKKSLDVVNVVCPYGVPADVFWVRETVGVGRSSGLYYYKANYPDGMINNNSISKFFDKWKPSIHMPKEAARLWLENVGVKLERLQDISEEDAIAEGIFYRADENDTELLDALFKDYRTGTTNLVSSTSSFMTLWQSINGQESWNANPWVWVIEFKRINKPTI